VSIRLAVAIGGALGALARVRVDVAVPAGTLNGFPFSTLLVNLTGAFALALLVARVRNPLARAAIGTGLLGAWTTFSALAVQTVVLFERAPVTAAAYVTVTLVGGVLAVRIGRLRAPDTAAGPQ
jgi:CrcB protein